MGIIIYLIAAILLIAWAIAFIGFALGGLIHFLLIAASVAIIVGIARGRRTKIIIKK